MDGIDTTAVGFRLSPQQQRALAGGRAGEVVQCAALLTGPANGDALRRALDRAATRHEILRTTFVQPPGMLVAQQAIGEEPSAAWSLLEEPSSAQPIDDPAALQRLLEREAQRGFDLASGPLLRAVLVGAGEPRALLVLSACAACADGGSLAALVQELCREGAEDSGEPVQHADYAEWRQELIGGEEPYAQEGLAYWREQERERPAQVRLLFAGQGSADGLKASGAPLALEAIDLTRLQRAATQAGVEAAVFLEAAWHATLARVSGAGELLLAGWCDGRVQPDLEGAIGPYEQPAPIRSRFADTATFAEILDQVRRQRALAERWQDCAGGDDLIALVEHATAGFAFHALGAPTPPLRDILALRPAAGGTPLTLALRIGRAGAGEDEGGGEDEDDAVGLRLTGELRYDGRAIGAEDARELGERFATLLAGALDDPTAPVAELAIVRPPERRRLLQASKGQAPTATAPVCKLFERQARLTPEVPAVVGVTGSLTYGELDQAANRLANHLRSLAAVERRTVALCMERTPSMVVALMAILKAGAAYLPLNYEHPQARLAHQLDDAGASVAIAEAHLLDSLPPSAATVVCVDRDAEQIAACAPASPGCAVTGEDLAYVMYTSGSTGMPKGVAVTHANLANYATAILARLSEQEDCSGLTFGVVSAISTDLGNTSIFAPIVCGGTIRLIGAEASMDGDLLAGELAGERLDALKIAPSHLRALIASGAAEALPTRWLIVGGEALSWELVEQVRALSDGQCRILNHYGPTETTVGCLTYAVDAQRRPDSATVPIGFPLAGVRAYVLDGRGQPLPAGVPGELCVAGVGVAAGYLGSQPQDRAGFTADPFAAGEGGRMYRTGDRVRRLRDGAIEFLGRLDDQVKIRGFRVQPGEVEAALLAHEAIRAAAVCAENDERGALRLVAYVVCGEAVTVEQLRDWLGRTLPDHMIPAAFRTAPELPLGPSGKVDRGALAGLAELQTKREADYVAPRDDVERQIAAIWAELLGVERVGARDDFFALGGHSLLATQATMKIRRLYGDVPLRALLAAPTVAALAEVIRAQGSPGAAAG